MRRPPRPRTTLPDPGPPLHAVALAAQDRPGQNGAEPRLLLDFGAALAEGPSFLLPGSPPHFCLLKDTPSHPGARVHETFGGHQMGLTGILGRSRLGGRGAERGQRLLVVTSLAPALCEGGRGSGCGSHLTNWTDGGRLLSPGAGLGAFRTLTCPEVSSPRDAPLRCRL